MTGCSSGGDSGNGILACAEPRQPGAPKVEGARDGALRAPLYCLYRRPIRAQPPGRRVQLTDMPTLFRFLVTIGIIAGIVYGAMFALVTFVQPKKGEMMVRVPLEKLDK